MEDELILKFHGVSSKVICALGKNNTQNDVTGSLGSLLNFKSCIHGR